MDRLIWVVGAGGMLGTDVVRRLGDLGLPFFASGRGCDVTDMAALREFVADRPVEWIINCAAYTAVDRAEEEEPEAEALNAGGPRNLGILAEEIGARIIHLSTDYVFDGEATSAYGEDTPPSPRGAYGRTKASGERALADATPAHFIVRTAWLYGIHGKSFVSTMLTLMNEREAVSVVDDQRGSPTYTVDLADALCQIVAADSTDYGIYHYTNEGETSWYGFATAIYEIGRRNGRITRACEVRPITSDQYPTKAVRPRYSVLSKTKITCTFGVTIPSWLDGLERFFAQLEREGDR